jgi:hypothetical protein
MRILHRNKVRIFYANYVDKVPVTDEDGYQTGEYEVVYSNPVEARGNVSSARGEVVTRQFGEDESYDRVIVMDDPQVPITQASVLWIDTAPTIQADGTTDTPYDYIVKKVAPSLNSVSIAVSKVNVRA